MAGQPLAGFGVVAVVVAARAAVGRSAIIAVAVGLLATGCFTVAHFALSCFTVASDVLLALFAIAHFALTGIAVMVQVGLDRPTQGRNVLNGSREAGRTDAAAIRHNLGVRS